MAANLSVKDVLFVSESSFIVSGVLSVISFQLPVGENSIVIVPCSFTFGISVDSCALFQRLKINFLDGRTLLFCEFFFSRLLLVAPGVDHVN